MCVRSVCVGVGGSLGSTGAWVLSGGGVTRWDGFGAGKRAILESERGSV